MKITVREVALALTLSAMGLTFNAPFFLNFMNMLNPLEGFAIYECINFAALSVLSHLDLVIFGIKIKSVVQTFGLWLCTFAYFLSCRHDLAVGPIRHNRLSPWYVLSFSSKRRRQ